MNIPARHYLLRALLALLCCTTAFAAAGSSTAADPVGRTAGNDAAAPLSGRGTGICDVLVVPALSETEYLVDNDFLTRLAALTGSAADYYNASGGTPTLAELQQYDLVITFADAFYSDRHAMGDVLADYVEGGGKVILGNYAHHTEGAGSWLDGRIMAQYNPAYVDESRWSGDYTGDGTDCVFEGVPPFHTLPYDHIDSVVGSAGLDGTYDDGSPVAAYRLDRSVYYVAGHLAGWLSAIPDPPATQAWAELTANICFCEPEPLTGACCDPFAGTCTDVTLPADCQPPLQWTQDATCASLDPPCGNPGACCDDSTGSCTQQLERNCAGRFEGGATCSDDPFVPACGDTDTCKILYAPTEKDNPRMRAEVEAITASSMDYFDARRGTPPLWYLAQFDMVVTWVAHPYDNAEAMGDVLANYVEQGGRVVLGLWSAPGGNNQLFLEGRLMEEYCPVTIGGLDWGGTTYADDGVDCIHEDVSFYSPRIWDQIDEIEPDAWSDGTYVNQAGEQYPSVAYRHDRKVFYISGFDGGANGAGDWAELLAGTCMCPAVDLYGACCDGTTGGCTDNVLPTDCLPPLQWTKDTQCADLNPECGNPGACCDEANGTCSWELEVECDGRFRPAESCESEPFDPPCGEYEGCTHSIVMSADSVAGWRDGYIDVYVGGILVLEGMTLLDGAGPEVVFFLAAPGEEITTDWHPGESGQYENSYCISSLDGSFLGCDGEGGEFPTGITVFGDCTEIECGNGVCQVNAGEDCFTCFLDCGECECISQPSLGQSAYLSDLDCQACGGGIQVLADNFRLFEETRIVGVKALGKYTPAGIPSDPDQFTLIFREDAGGLPGAPITSYGPMPGSRIALGANEYEHAFAVDETLPAGAYWLEIYNSTDDTDDTWAWFEAELDPNNGLPGLAFSMEMPENWGFNAYLDLAFELECVGGVTITVDKSGADVTVQWDAPSGFTYDALHAPLGGTPWTRVENVLPPWHHQGAVNDGVDYMYRVEAIPAAPGGHEVAGGESYCGSAW